MKRQLHFCCFRFRFQKKPDYVIAFLKKSSPFKHPLCFYKINYHWICPPISAFCFAYYTKEIRQYFPICKTGIKKSKNSRGVSMTCYPYSENIITYTYIHRHPIFLCSLSHYFQPHAMIFFVLLCRFYFSLHNF